VASGSGRSSSWPAGMALLDMEDFVGVLSILPYTDLRACTPSLAYLPAEPTSESIASAALPGGEEKASGSETRREGVVPLLGSSDCDIDRPGFIVIVFMRVALGLEAAFAGPRCLRCSRMSGVLSRFWTSPLSEPAAEERRCIRYD
jgi:hypothetical protein